MSRSRASFAVAARTSARASALHAASTLGRESPSERGQPRVHRLLFALHLGVEHLEAVAHATTARGSTNRVAPLLLVA